MKPGEVVIKNPDVLRSLMEYRFEPIRVSIVIYIANKHGIIITEGYRVKKHRNDLHGTIPVRAIDIRSWVYPDTKVYRIMTAVNNKWEYDFKRPNKKTMIVHDVGRGIHAHIQCSPNTRLRSIT